MRVLGVYPYLAVLVVSSACGGSDPIPMEKVPSAAEARSFYGLNPGSCWTYRFGSPAAYATVTITGPNDRAISGQTAYIQEYQPAATTLTRQTYLSVNDAGEVALLRTVDGEGSERTTKSFVDVRPGGGEGMVGPPPLVAKVIYGDDDALTLDTAELSANVSPLIATAGSADLVLGDAEQHEWTVLGEEPDTATHDGTATAFKLGYTRGGVNAFYWLVPEYGIAKFNDFDGTFHEVCAARVCGSEGCSDPCPQTSCP